MFRVETTSPTSWQPESPTTGQSTVIHLRRYCSQPNRQTSGSGVISRKAALCLPFPSARCPGFAFVLHALTWAVGG